MTTKIRRKAEARQRISEKLDELLEIVEGIQATGKQVLELNCVNGKVLEVSYAIRNDNVR